MSKKKLKKEDNYPLDLLNLLLFENSILRKQVNNEDLTPREHFFITYIVSPSTILKSILERNETNETRNKRKN